MARTGSRSRYRRDEVVPHAKGGGRTLFDENVEQLEDGAADARLIDRWGRLTRVWRFKWTPTALVGSIAHRQAD